MHGTKIFVWNREMFEIWKFEDERENMTGINEMVKVLRKVFEVEREVQGRLSEFLKYFKCYWADVVPSYNIPESVADYCIRPVTILLKIFKYLQTG